MTKEEQLVEKLLSNNIRAFLYEDKNKITIEHYKYGLIDYFYKGDKILIRNTNTWIELGRLWIDENIIINEIVLFTKKEVKQLMIKYISNNLNLDTTSIEDNIEMFININIR